MKYPELTGICKECLGCNKLENPLFTGTTYLQNIAGTITAVVLCATLVYELVGPFITKVALTKANEIPTIKK